MKIIRMRYSIETKDRIYVPASTLHKSNEILELYFGNLRKLLSANIDATQS